MELFIGNQPLLNKVVTQFRGTKISGERGTCSGLENLLVSSNSARMAAIASAMPQLAQYVWLLVILKFAIRADGCCRS